MSDLVERLRRWNMAESGGDPTQSVMRDLNEAADEIERLRKAVWLGWDEIERLRHEIDVQCSSEYVERILKENERLRAALEEIAINTPRGNSVEGCRRIAREALRDE